LRHRSVVCSLAGRVSHTHGAMRSCAWAYPLPVCTPRIPHAQRTRHALAHLRFCSLVLHPSIIAGVASYGVQQSNVALDYQKRSNHVKKRLGEGVIRKLAQHTSYVITGLCVCQYPLITFMDKTSSNVALDC